MSNNLTHIRPAAMLLPRFVLNLNALAQQSGLTVTMDISPYTGETQPRIWATWRGTRAQLCSTGLLATFQQKLLLVRDSFHLTTPEDWRCHVASGVIDIQGEQISWAVDCGPSLFSIERKGEVEVVTYAEKILYHGRRDALIAAGIDPKRIPPQTGVRGGRSNILDARPWCCRRQPDGLFVYRVESEPAAEAREAEQEARQAAERRRWSEYYGESQAASAENTKKRRPAYIRLVVDNTASSVTAAD